MSSLVFSSEPSLLLLLLFNAADAAGSWQGQIATRQSQLLLPDAKLLQLPLFRPEVKLLSLLPPKANLLQLPLLRPKAKLLLPQLPLLLPSIKLLSLQTPCPLLVGSRAAGAAGMAAIVKSSDALGCGVLIVLVLLGGTLKNL
jgi:hypothetical protein